MKLYRPNKDRKQLSSQVEHFLRLMEETQPKDGHLVITAWVSPGQLSEADRIRLHQHLIDTHGALSVLTIGLADANSGTLLH